MELTGTLGDPLAEHRHPVAQAPTLWSHHN